jgi:hypothetical protein
MRKLAHKIHETQKQAAVAPPSLEQQIAVLNEVLGALVDVVGPTTVQARLDARRLARQSIPAKGKK